MNSVKLLAIWWTISMVHQSNEIVGVWLVENGLEIEIYEQNNYYFGRIQSLNGFNDGQLLDSENPVDSLTNKPLVGLVILKNLRFDASENAWVEGTMYAPSMGMTANLEITDVNENGLTAVGSKFIFWRTEVWSKAD